MHVVCGQVLFPELCSSTAGLNSLILNRALRRHAFSIYSQPGVAAAQAAAEAAVAAAAAAAADDKRKEEMVGALNHIAALSLSCKH